MKLSSLSIAYLKLIERTSAIEFYGLEKLGDNFQAGFWHQDSLIMCLVLRIAARRGLPVTVVMTADQRGNTIEEVVRAFKGESFRLSYAGRAARGALKDLIRRVDENSLNVATPLDGPLGPLHEPKKFMFLLAHKTGCDFVGVRVEYARKISLTSRWDNYVIPLPFNRIKVYVHNLGPVSADDLRDFEAYKSMVQRLLLTEESYAALGGAQEARGGEAA